MKQRPEGCRKDGCEEPGRGQAQPRGRSPSPWSASRSSRSSAPGPGGGCIRGRAKTPRRPWPRAGPTRSCAAPRSPSPTPRPSGAAPPPTAPATATIPPASSSTAAPPKPPVPSAPSSPGLSTAATPGRPRSTSPSSRSSPGGCSGRRSSGWRSSRRGSSAGHLQRETGMLDAAALRLIGAGRGKRATVGEALELQGDCLTGAWAAVAEKRLGPVPGGFWSQLVWSWRNAVGDLGSQGAVLPAELDVFARASQEAREAGLPPGLRRARRQRLPAAGRDRRPRLSHGPVRGGRGPAARAPRAAACRRAAPAAPWSGRCPPVP